MIFNVGEFKDQMKLSGSIYSTDNGTKLANSLFDQRSGILLLFNLFGEFNFISVFTVSTQMDPALQAIKSKLRSEKMTKQTMLIRTPRKYKPVCDMPCQLIPMMISTKRVIKQVSKILKKDPSDIRIIDSNGNPMNGKIDLGSCKGFCSR